MANQFQGTVQAVQKQGVGKTGWGWMDVVLQGGQPLSLSITPDDMSAGLASKVVPGATFTFSEGKFPGKYMIKTAPQRAAQGGRSGGSYSKGKGGGKDSYWNQKFDYEVNRRDPKIEFQTFHSRVVELMGDMMPQMLPYYLNPGEDENGEPKKPTRFDVRQAMDEIADDIGNLFIGKIYKISSEVYFQVDETARAKAQSKARQSAARQPQVAQQQVQQTVQQNDFPPANVVHNPHQPMQQGQQQINTPDAQDQEFGDYLDNNGPGSQNGGPVQF